MSSQLNVDTIVDKAGSGGTNVKIGNTSTNVSDGGAVTQNTVQGLAKCWVNFKSASTFVTNDSFNVSSIADNDAGVGTVSITNDMNNDDYAVTVSSQAINILNEEASQAVGSFKLFTFNSSVVAADYQKSASLHGDLA